MKHKLGEIVRGSSIGYYKGSAKYIRHACVVCGKERWVHYVKGEARNVHCKPCSNRDIVRNRKIGWAVTGSRHPSWKGGRFKSSGGYIMVRVYPDNFFYPMINSYTGYVPEHRLVMAKSMGKCLNSWEIVHHINHIRDDNRIENLQLVSDDRHKQITIMERRIRYLEGCIIKLEQENKILKGGVIS